MTTTLHTITHPEHGEDYWRGYETMKAEIAGMGWTAARDKFNTENPVGQNLGNLGAYYHAKGGASALLETFPENTLAAENKA